MPVGTGLRFAIAGLLGAVPDFLVFRLLHDRDFDLAISHVASFALAAIFTYSLFAWREHAAGASPALWRRYWFVRACVVGLLALFLRGGVLDLLANNWHVPLGPAAVAAIAIGAIVSCAGSLGYVLGPSRGWTAGALGLLGYALALRFVFLGSVDLLPQEAYYWNYSQHLDIGYLDHPPMVAWLIRLATGIFGDTEFGVRFAAYGCWAAAAAFCFLLTRELYGRAAAWMAVLLLATLPFFFGIGFFMTPDAPLTAAWAGALYFLSQALLRERSAAWWGVGLCLGLGLLSKYTIALLGPAALLSWR